MLGIGQCWASVNTLRPRMRPHAVASLAVEVVGHPLPWAHNVIVTAGTGSRSGRICGEVIEVVVACSDLDDGEQ